MEYSVNYREKDGGIQVIVQYKDKSGKWRQKSRQGFRGRSAKKLAKIEADKIIDSIKEDYNYDVEYKDMLIGEIKENYLNHIKIHKEHSTYLNYSQGLSHYSALDSISFTNLKLIDVQNCVDIMVKDGLSYNTLDRWTTIFKMFVNWSSENYEIKVPSLKKLTIPSKKQADIKEKTALDIEQVDNIIEFYRTRSNYSLDYYIACLLAGKCGMRIGEICAITPDKIDFKSKHINVCYQWKILKETESFGFGELKTKNSYRLIPFSDEVKSALKEIICIRGIDPHQRLISSSSTRSVTVNLDRVLKRKFNITVHELRHSYVCNLIHKGLDFKTIAKLIGDDVEEVLRTYSHVTPGMMENAREIIENIDKDKTIKIV